MASDLVALDCKWRRRERYMVLREQMRQKETLRDSSHDDIDNR